MLRSATDEDLSTSKFVSLKAIRKECFRLVRFIPAEDSEEDGTLELNHAAVFAFLREDAETDELRREDRVASPDLICDLCVKYLSQPAASEEDPLRVYDVVWREYPGPSTALVRCEVLVSPLR